MMPKVAETIPCQKCHKGLKKKVKVFAVARVMYGTILNTAVFLTLNLRIIFIMKASFDTVKNAFNKCLKAPFLAVYLYSCLHSSYRNYPYKL